MTDFFLLLKNELGLCVLLLFLLVMKISGRDNASFLLPAMQWLLLFNFVFSLLFNSGGRLFGGMFDTSPLLAFQKAILNLALYLSSLLFESWLRKSAHLAEFFLLTLSSLLGFFLLISSAHFLMFYLSLELATLPVAALAGFAPMEKRSSEAAMKMILSAAFSSAVLLFGISLIYGLAGTLYFKEVPAALKEHPLTWLAVLFLIAAFAFKLSVVPFHLWTADVYEGAPASVSSYLSVISKGAVAFVFVSALHKIFVPLKGQIQPVLLGLTLITILIGNLFALRQQNIKRFLAFSSITQAGYILFAISSLKAESFTPVIYFIIIYIFSNLAAWSVASVMSSSAGKENQHDYAGLYYRNRFLAVALVLSLVSLAGIPPAAGFFGKWFLILQGASAAKGIITVFVALNLILSLYYYLKWIWVVFQNTNAGSDTITPTRMEKTGLILCVAGILLIGFWGDLYRYIVELVKPF
ncbi:MAG: NADH-quinone oxidoreductase subunit N [Chitinophagaceae bacterium]|nr:NADH-quinone oxidoreductase subunit N [Chitinophagaceae bacterium]